MLLLYEWQLLPQPLLNLSAYFEDYRQEYYDRLLAVSQRGKWEVWARMTRLQNIRAKFDAIVQKDEIQPAWRQ